MVGCIGSIGANILPGLSGILAGAFQAVSWSPEVLTAVAPNISQAAGTDLTAAGFTKSGTTGSITMNGDGSIAFASSDGVGAAYLYETGAQNRFIEAMQNNVFFTGVFAIAAIDQNNYIGARWISGGVDITAKINGAFITDASITGTVSPAIGWASTIRLELVMGTIRVYCNGALRKTITIPAALAGTTKVGLIARNGNEVNNAASLITIGTGRINHGHTQGIGQSNQSARPVYANGKVFMGLSTWTVGSKDLPAIGEARAVAIDTATGAATTYVLGSGAGWGDGSHAAASIMVRPDGRLVATYTLHSDSTGVRYRVSVNPYDVSAWSQEYVISGTGGSGGATYTNLLYMSTPNKTFCFFRGTDLGSEYVTSPDLNTISPSTADGGALPTAPTWTSLVNLIPLPTGSQKGIYTSMWSDGVNRIDFVATNAIDGQGNTIDVRHGYFQADTQSFFNSGGASITPSTGATFGYMTAVATTGSPDNMGKVFCLDVRRRDTGLIEALFWQTLSASDHRYFYATYANGSWNKAEIDAGTGSGVPDSRSGTIDIDNTGGSVRVGQAAIDFNTPGLIYVSVGNHMQTDLYAYRTINSGASFSRARVSPPAPPNPTGSPRTVFGANIYPSTPRNAPAKFAVLWSRGRWDYYDTTAAAAYALDIMSCGTDGTTLVP
jgi:hypothetical protein